MRRLPQVFEKVSAIQFFGGHIPTYVTGHGERAHFAHYFKIDLLVFNGSVDLKQYYAVYFLSWK